MDQFGFVKDGLESLRLARPASAKDQLIYRIPCASLPPWCQLTVDSDEVCLFFRQGLYVGALGKGRHALHGQTVAFLDSTASVDSNASADSKGSSPDQVFAGDVYFVALRCFHNEKLSGAIGPLDDSVVELPVHAEGSYSFRVVDPVRFVRQLLEAEIQAGAPLADALSNCALRWVQAQVLVRIETILSQRMGCGELTYLDLRTAGREIAGSVVASWREFGALGLQVLDVSGLELTLSEEDEQRVRSLQDSIVQAKMRARAAQAELSRRTSTPPPPLAVPDFSSQALCEQELAVAALRAGTTAQGENAALVSARWDSGSVPAFQLSSVKRFAGEPYDRVCIHCSSVNPPAARFCGECARSL